MTKNENNISDSILVDWVLPEKKLESGWTKASLFLLPLVNINLNQRKDILPYIENCFLSDSFMQEYEFFTSPLYILLKTKDYNDPVFKVACNFLRGNGNYVYEYEVGEKEDYKLTMIVLNIPLEHDKDVCLFKSGKYSEMSQKIKDKYTQEVYNRDLTKSQNLAYHACFKTEMLKKTLIEECGVEEEDFEYLKEWCDKPEKEREIYRYKNK